MNTDITAVNESGSFSATHNGITVKLLNQHLWREYDGLSMEMVADPHGRCVWPEIMFCAAGLISHHYYIVTLDFRRQGNNRYTFNKDTKRWYIPSDPKSRPIIRSACMLNGGRSITGLDLMTKNINFSDIKLANRNTSTRSPSRAKARRGHRIELDTQFFYRPYLVIHNAGVAGPPIFEHHFPITKFVLVTAYQNKLVRSKKIDQNPKSAGHKDKKNRPMQWRDTAEMDEQMNAKRTRYDFAVQDIGPEPIGFAMMAPETCWAAVSQYNNEEQLYREQQQQQQQQPAQNVPPPGVWEISYTQYPPFQPHRGLLQNVTNTEDQLYREQQQQQQQPAQNVPPPGAWETSYNQYPPFQSHRGILQNVTNQRFINQQYMSTNNINTTEGIVPQNGAQYPVPATNTEQQQYRQQQQQQKQQQQQPAQNVPPPGVCETSNTKHPLFQSHGGLPQNQSHPRFINTSNGNTNNNIMTTEGIVPQNEAQYSVPPTKSATLDAMQPQSNDQTVDNNLGDDTEQHRDLPQRQQVQPSADESEPNADDDFMRVFLEQNPDLNELAKASPDALPELPDDYLKDLFESLENI